MEDEFDEDMQNEVDCQRIEEAELSDLYLRHVTDVYLYHGRQAN